MPAGHRSSSCEKSIINDMKLIHLLLSWGIEFFWKWVMENTLIDLNHIALDILSCPYV